MLLVVLTVLPIIAAKTVPFQDVNDTSTHAPAISWAVDQGITKGCGDGSNYCPDEPVTRGQMATFLHRLSQTASTPTATVAAGTTIHRAEMNVIESTDGVTPPPRNVQTLGTVGPLTFQGSCWEHWGPRVPGFDETQVPYGNKFSDFEIIGGDRTMNMLGEGSGLWRGEPYVFAGDRIWKIEYAATTDPFVASRMDSLPMTQDCIFIWIVTEIGEP
jgi:hypothetical protein